MNVRVRAPFLMVTTRALSLEPQVNVSGWKTHVRVPWHARGKNTTGGFQWEEVKKG